MHKKAFKAAEATQCAADQGKYWEMHNRLFENQKALEPWSGHAKALGLETEAFDACMTDGKHVNSIRAAMKEASKVGITGTPGFVLATTDPKNPNKVKGISYLRGAQSYTAFRTQIDQALIARTRANK